MHPKKLNIAFFVHSFPAVSETFITNQIIQLIKAGHHVDIFAQFQAENTSMHGEVLKYNLLEKTVFLNTLPTKRIDKIFLFFAVLFRNIKLRNLSLALYYIPYLLGNKKRKVSFYSIIYFLDKPAYDIAHAHYGFIGNQVLLLKEIGLLQKAKLITTFHGFDFAVQHGGYEKLFAKGNLFTVNSNYSRSKLTALGCSEQKIKILPVGLDLTLFNHTASKHSNPNRKFKVLFVGRLVPIKAPELFVDICANLINQIDFQSQLIGDGEMLEVLQNKVESENLSCHIQLLGKQTQEQITAHLSEADVLILTGKEIDGLAETQGLVIQEAQAMGVPVLVSNVGGMKEGIIPDKSGYVIESNNPAAFVEKIVHLYHNAALRKEMGNTARDFVTKKYDIQLLNSQLLDYYYQAV